MLAKHVCAESESCGAEGGVDVVRICVTSVMKEVRKICVRH